MKHLIIIGIPRCGKTALSHAVVNRLALAGNTPMLITGDMIFYAFNQMCKKQFKSYRIISILKHICPPIIKLYDKHRKRMFFKFLCDYMDITTARENVVIVYEGAQISPELATKIFSPDKFKIVSVASPNMTPDEKFKIIRQTDKTHHRMGNLSDAQLMKVVTRLIERCKQNESECEKYNIPLIDTSDNYHEKLNSFADSIIEFLK